MKADPAAHAPLLRTVRMVFLLQWLLAIGLAGLVVGLFVNFTALRESQDRHMRLTLLAKELRQSSDDLTRMVRTYVATGDPEFAREYHEVLAIRRGSTPRPLHYDRIYWDIVSATGRPPRPAGPAIPLLTLIQQEGATAEEIAELDTARQQSDALVATEETAMHAIRGLFRDARGEFTVTGAPDRDLALRLVHDADYHQAKARIMEPIGRFYVLTAERMRREVAQREITGLRLLGGSALTAATMLGVMVYSFLLLQRQVRERHEAETTAALARDHYLQLLQGAPALIWRADREGGPDWFNRTWLTFAGRSLSEEIDGAADAGVHPDDRTGYVEHRRAAWNRREARQVEYRRRRHDGEYRWIAEQMAPRADLAGNFAGLLGYGTDITDAKRLVDQLAAESRAKGELLREVNHRVTNNLTSILGLVATESAGLAAPSAKVAAPILDRLYARILSLLEAHRLLSARQWDPVRIDELTDQIVRAAIAADASRLPADVRVHPADIRISPRQAGNLALILFELTTNAVKYGHTSKVRPLEITVTFDGTPEAVGMTFRDRGPGFPPDVLSGARSDVGLQLVRQLAAGSLRGEVSLANDDGASVTLRFRPEGLHRT